MKYCEVLSHVSEIILILLDKSGDKGTGGYVGSFLFISPASFHKMDAIVLLLDMIVLVDFFVYEMKEDLCIHVNTSRF